jgi:hypothetical protein
VVAGRAAIPDATPPEPVVRDRNVRLLLRKCDLYKVAYEDLREKRGSLWIYTDKTTYPSLAKSIEEYGFKYTDKRGFWLDSKG